MPMFVHRFIFLLLVGQAATAIKLNANTSNEAEGMAAPAPGPAPPMPSKWKMPSKWTLEKFKCLTGIFKALVETSSFAIQAIRFGIFLKDKDTCPGVTPENRKKCSRIAMSIIEGSLGFFAKLTQVQGYCSKWESALIKVQGLSPDQLKELAARDFDKEELDGVKREDWLAQVQGSEVFSQSLKDVVKKERTKISDAFKELGTVKGCRAYTMGAIGTLNGLAGASLQIDETCAGVAKPPKTSKILEPCEYSIAKSILGGISTFFGLMKIYYLEDKREFIGKDFSKWYDLFHETFGVVTASVGLASKIIGTLEECTDEPMMDADNLCKATGTKLASKSLKFVRIVLYLRQKCSKYWPHMMPHLPFLNYKRMFTLDEEEDARFGWDKEKREAAVKLIKAEEGAPPEIVEVSTNDIIDVIEESEFVTSAKDDSSIPEPEDWDKLLDVKPTNAESSLPDINLPDIKNGGESLVVNNGGYN